MKKIAVLFLLSALLPALAGCWNKYELDQFGFVMAVALDQGEDGNLDLTTLLYRPAFSKGGQGGRGSEKQSSNILIKTTDDSLFEAIRDIPLKLGRKAQWGHMRAILIGEKLAMSADVGKLIDFFYRDHEPRHSTSILIAKGRADRILQNEPVIEGTTGQQLLLTSQVAHKNSAKSIETTLLDLALQLNSPQNDTFIAYIYEDPIEPGMFTAAGLALLKNGKMKGIVPADKVEGLAMLRDEYKSGIVEIRCPGKQGEIETVEILSLSTKLKPKLTEDKVAVQIKTEVDGGVGELKCTEIKTREDEVEFVGKLEKAIKQQMMTTIRYLQSEQTDVIGIGNKIFRMDPDKWKTMKKTWERQFAEIPFDIQVELKLLTSGTIISKPAVWKETE
jgi:spore germination protein KC